MTKLADDVLKGAREIGEFLGMSERRVYWLLENNQIPAFKLGTSWYARKSKLMAHIEELEQGAA